jgi:chemotaxis protein CheD
MVAVYKDKGQPLPRSLAGFETVNRYWDKTVGKIAAKILPGELYVTKDDEIIVTVLGSCVSACVRDAVFGIGGMNHFMLPLSTENGGWNSDEFGMATRYGNFAMEHLINEILKNGGMRKNLEVKIFGGGRVLAEMNMMDVGRRNIEFVKEYIHMEGLKLLAEDVGDIYPRKVQFHPMSGKARMKKLRSMHNSTIVDREKKYMRQIKQEPETGDIELF